jgi:glycosyltransferase involved in cell wall biosynthesis
MQVVFLPDTDLNPYHDNMASALSSRDIDVRIGVEGGLLPILRSIRPVDDVSCVHFHWVFPYLIGSTTARTVIKTLLTTFQLLLLRLLNVPVVWTVHDVVSHEAKHPVYERLCKGAFVRLGFCDHLIVHCSRTRERVIEEFHLSEDPAVDISVIPHGHYIGTYPNEVSRADARTRLGLDPDQTVFLFFGHLREYKGVVELLETFPTVDNESILLVAGNPYDDEIADRIKQLTDRSDRIRLSARRIPDDEIQLYMNSTDVVVLPFKTVTTSGSAILAMSFKKPVVAPRLGCLPELLDDSGGILYPPELSNGLSNSLEAAKNIRFDKVGTRNYEKIKQQDWGTVADQTVSVYKQVQ